MHDIIIERIEQLQAFEIGHTIKVDDWFAIALADGQLVLKTPHHIRHFGELVKVLQLTEHINSLLHHLIVVLRQRHVGYRIILFGITVILVVIYLDRRIIAKFVGAHHLNIALNGTD